MGARELGQALAGSKRGFQFCGGTLTAREWVAYLSDWCEPNALSLT